MGQPAAKQGDQVVATDTHIIMIPSPGGPVPTPLPHPFTGQIDGGLSSDVNVEGKPAAVQGSTATNALPPGLTTPMSVHRDTIAAATAASTAFPPCRATSAPASAAIRDPAAIATRALVMRHLQGVAQIERSLLSRASSVASYGR